jgi:hypothetical protein
VFGFLLATFWKSKKHETGSKRLVFSSLLENAFVGQQTFELKHQNRQQESGFSSPP